MSHNIKILSLVSIISHTLCKDIEFYPSKFLLEPSYKEDLNLRPDDNIKPEICDSKLFSFNFNTLCYRRDVDKRYFFHGNEVKESVVKKRAVDPTFHGHPKTREELWHQHFLNETTVFDQTPSLIKLINNITLTYLDMCTPVILYDKQVKSMEGYLLQNLLKDFPVSYVHGFIDEKNHLIEPKILQSTLTCLHFIIFLDDVKVISKILDKQPESKVVVVARSSQWAVQEFLSSPLSRKFVNLLIIGQSFKEEDSLVAPFILYTHKFYTDGLGTSKPQVLTSWSNGKFSREVNLFPTKMTGGYSGHRFVIAAANQPPFVIRRVETDLDGGNPRVVWDGIEIRLLHLLAARNNFSIEFSEPRNLQFGPGDAVAKEIVLGRADMGAAGMYMTKERSIDMDMSFAHSQDCATFVTLMSTALPRYRAILGPFHWHVWVALTLTYLFGIFPLAFSDKHTLRHLFNNTGEIENMFWYVFGTFTNAFTFIGKNSWSKSTKITTRLLVGWYWLFTIIITSCYTGSIIAFVTLPIFPETVDSIKQLLRGFYRVGTLDHGGWDRWFFNSSDPDTNKLLKKMEFVETVQAGIRNTTKAFFWPYAFLGSQAELEYIVQSNFSVTKSKRSLLHISNECFVPFGVSLAFPTKSLYTEKLSGDVRRMIQYGILDKIVDEVRWEMQRSSTGKFLSVTKGSFKISSVEERGLTLEDTQGMFLLLGAGFLIAATALVSEWMGGFTRQCRKIKRKFSNTGNSRDDLVATESPTSASETIHADTDSRLDFRASPTDSDDILDGSIINVSDYDITIHNDKMNKFESRRSSSLDLEREVREIFETDEKRRKLASNGIVLDTKREREKAASRVFGDPVLFL